MLYQEFLDRYHWNPLDPATNLGEGGFGKVYCALDTHQNRQVAIKESKVGDHKFTLQREVELSHELKHHPNLVHYANSYRFDIARGITYDYAVMEYFPEGSLEQVISRFTFSEKAIQQIVSGILSGLAHLHDEQCIHRDLKTSNILMARVGNEGWIPKISDFGLSRFTRADASVSNSSIGISYSYAAPEQLRGQSVSYQTDLWAFGIIVYKILTRELPFNSTSGTSSSLHLQEIAQQLQHLQLPERLNTIAEPYQSLIRQCIVVDRGQRVKSAANLIILHDQYVKSLSDSQAFSPFHIEQTRLKEPASQIPIELIAGPSTQAIPQHNRIWSKRKVALLGLGLVLFFACLIGYLYSSYDEVGEFSEGLAVAIKGKKWGYINRLGWVAIPLEFDMANRFHEGFAVVIKGGNYMYIDQIGKPITSLKFDSADSFNNGLAVVSKGDKKGYINQTGRVVIPFEFDIAGWFGKDSAWVRKGDREFYINRKGEEIK